MAAEVKQIDYESNKSLMFNGKNSGSYIWKIDNKQTINNMLNANNGQLFESLPFYMSKLKWQIRLYPNGNQLVNRGSVKIFLKLLSLPSEFDRLMLSFSLLCDKGMSCHTDMRIYNKSGQGSGWLDKTLSLSEWRNMNINQCSILITIKIHYIALKKEIFINNDSILSRFVPDPYDGDSGDLQLKTRAIYQINKNMMNAFKWSHNGKRMESAMYDNMWRLQCYPNGNGKECEGFVSLYLRCCYMPPLVQKIKAKFKIICKETGKILNTQNEFSYQKKDLGSRKFVKLSDISSLETITFIVEIEIIDVTKIQENNQQDRKCVFHAPQQIEEILGLVSDQKPMEGGDREIMHNDNMKSLNPQYNHFNDVKDGPHAEERKLNEVISSPNIKERLLIHEAKLQSLTVNVEENKKLMIAMQRNIENLSKQIDNLKLGTFEEKKNDELNDIKKELKLIKENMGNLDKNEDVKKEETLMEKWLKYQVNLPQYIDVFTEHGLEHLETVRLMTENELEMIGIDKIGHRKKIIHEINKMQMNGAQNNRGQTHQEGVTAFM